MYAGFIQALKKKHRLPEIPEFDGTSARGHLLWRMIEIEGKNITLFRRFCNDKISYSVNRCSWKDFDFNKAVFIPIIVTDRSYRYPGSIFAAATCETKLTSRVKAARALIITRDEPRIKFEMTNESKGPRTKMLLVYVGATDSSNQPKIKYKDNKLQGWHYVEMKSLNGTTTW